MQSFVLYKLFLSSIFHYSVILIYLKISNFERAQKHISKPCIILHSFLLCISFTQKSVSKALASSKYSIYKQYQPTKLINDSNYFSVGIYI